MLQATICELTYHQFASQIGLGHVNTFASLSQTAKFFNAFELFAYCLTTSTAYWQRRLPDNYNNKLGTLAKFFMKIKLKLEVKLGIVAQFILLF